LDGTLTRFQSAARLDREEIDEKKAHLSAGVSRSPSVVQAAVHYVATERRSDGARMAKHDDGTKGTNTGATTTSASDATAADAMEQRVMAFAEQLGRIAGTVQAKAEGWMDRETLNKQIAKVRDGAADLLEQLAGSAPKASTKKPAAAAARGASKGRSRGVVDAPGKKHRKPMPTDPGANIADSQAAKMRAAKTMVKTNRRRGRG
jgi:hypothetical protein